MSLEINQKLQGTFRDIESSYRFKRVLIYFLAFQFSSMGLDNTNTNHKTQIFIDLTKKYIHLKLSVWDQTYIINQ